MKKIVIILVAIFLSNISSARVFEDLDELKDLAGFWRGLGEHPSSGWHNARRFYFNFGNKDGKEKQWKILCKDKEFDEKFLTLKNKGYIQYGLWYESEDLVRKLTSSGVIEWKEDKYGFYFIEYWKLKSGRPKTTRWDIVSYEYKEADKGFFSSGGYEGYVLNLENDLGGSLKLYRLENNLILHHEDGDIVWSPRDSGSYGIMGN